MKHLLIAAFFGTAMLLQAEDSLKKEVIAQLDVVLKKSEGVPPGMTGEALYERIAEDVDFSLTAEQSKQLAGGKTLHTEADRAAMLKLCDQLKGAKSPLFEDAILNTIKDDAAAARDREAAYQLMGAFNEQKVRRLRMINVMNAKQLVLMQLTEGPDIKQEESMLFQAIDGAKKWLFKPAGYGELIKDAEGSKVIVMAPEPIGGKLVLGCEDGSVHTKTVEEVKGKLDLSQVKMPGKP